MSTEPLVLRCPSCQTRFEVAPEKLAGEESVLVLCGMCGETFRSDDENLPADERVRADDVARDALAPRVVVGHEHPAAARTLATVLRRGGYSPLLVRDGAAVLQACDPAMPAPAIAVCIDVAVPEVMSFEVIAHLRSMPQTKEMPVILLASIFEKTRYKRLPNRLYGADAYLELHHVPDKLVSLLDTLRNKSTPSPDRVQAPSHRAAAAPLRTLEGATGEVPVRTLARRLISDVALYHGDEIARGVGEGKPMAHIGAALDEARTRLTSTAAEADADVVFDEEVDAFADRLISREKDPLHG